MIDGDGVAGAGTSRGEEGRGLGLVTYRFRPSLLHALRPRGPRRILLTSTTGRHTNIDSDRRTDRQKGTPDRLTERQVDDRQTHQTRPDQIGPEKKRQTHPPTYTHVRPSRATRASTCTGSTRKLNEARWYHHNHPRERKLTNQDNK